MSETKTIVFIHGLFQNPKSWEKWMAHFEGLGYTCYAPAYPFHSGEPADLRKNIDPGLGKLTFTQVLDTLIKFIDGLPEKPIVIGHSMGGLFVQKLLNMDKVAAAVAIDAAPPKGIFTAKWSFLKPNLATVNPFKGDSPFMPSLKWFKFAFLNDLNDADARKVVDEYCVPESRNIPRSSTTKAGAIDFKKPHNPLLIIAGGNDNIIPHSLNEKNFKAYKDPNSKREFKIFPGRTHYICGQPNWKEVADFIAEWIR
ncbi:MAG: alpha/beta hydrolase [Bacteroidia bacterium]|nr:alpha/beta hydrolase [Bacteroidia bacterium]